MRTHLSPALVMLAHNFAKIPFVKRLLKPFYYPYIARIEKNRLRCLHANGLKVLKEFDKIMVQHEFHYCVFAGTLLGTIREQGFIKHDLDIDTAIWNKDYSPEIKRVLENNGFRRTRYFEVEGGRLGREETYMKDGVDVDIFYIYTDEMGHTYNCDFYVLPETVTFQESMKKYGRIGVRKCIFPLQYDIIRHSFETIEVNIPTNAHEWLSNRYGSDYLIPNPDFADTGEEKNIIYWTSVHASI